MQTASLTPDPKKRGYLLPPSCKNLADVLNRRKKPGTGADFLASGGLFRMHSETITSQFSELERHVTRVCESGALTCSLALDFPDAGFAVRLHGGMGVAANVSLTVQIGTDREKAVRGFVVRHGFPLPVDKGMPAQFRPDLPVYQIHRLAPLPAGAPLVTVFLKALLQEVVGLNDDSAWCFRYDETTSVA